MKVFQISLTDREDMRWRWIKTMIVMAPDEREAKTEASKHELHGGDLWLKNSVECFEINLEKRGVIAF